MVSRDAESSERSAGSPARQAGQVPPRSRHLLLCALASSGLLYLSHFPVAWGWLGWVALVPLLTLVRSPLGNGRVFLIAWLAGLVFYFPVLQWLRVANAQMYYSWLGLSFYMSFYLPVGVLLVRSLHRGARTPLVLAVPLVWTSMEFLKAHVFGGFAWYYLAHTQHDFLPFIQLADVTGTFGLTFIIAAANAVIFEWCARLAAVKQWERHETAALAPTQPKLVFHSAAVLLAIAGCLLYGSRRMAEADFEEGPRVAIVQCNMDQALRNAGGGGDLTALKELIEQSEALSSLAGEFHPDLVIWPETSYPDSWDVAEIGSEEFVPKGSRQMLAEVARLHGLSIMLGARWNAGTDVLLGLITIVYDDEGRKKRRYNSALLVRADGSLGGRYDKMHRVPFGEYVPLRDTLPWLRNLVPYDYDYSVEAGTEQVRLTVGRYRFGVLSCYEDTDAPLSRGYVDPATDNKVHFLVNISNDGWFDGTAEHEEHLAISRFRAIEARRSLVRSVNMGVSAVVDGNGRVLLPKRVDERPAGMVWEVSDIRAELPVSRWHEFKKVAGVMLARVPIDDRTTLYARWGDWFAWLCSVSVVGLLIRARICACSL